MIEMTTELESLKQDLLAVKGDFGAIEGEIFAKRDEAQSED